MTVDGASLYLSFTRDAEGVAHCTAVLPKGNSRIRFVLSDLEDVVGSLDGSVAEAIRRSAPALPGGRRVGIIVKVPEAPERLVRDGSSGPSVEGWDPASGRFFEESSIGFEELMLCVEERRHDWRYHAFAKQDRCTRCQVLKDGTYL